MRIRSESRALIGRRVGPYLVEDVIGEGAMGAVYTATDVNLKRKVALKVIHAALAADPRYCERFLREARAAARLNHPNIVQIYAAGTTGAVPYLALELVEGGSLRRLLRRAGGRIPARRACEIVRGGALGLGAAHAQGIVHRDVKPDNFLVVSEEPGLRGEPIEVKLSDFGIAQLAAAAAARITESGFFVGTPAYSSPEQCGGGEVDHRSDLYSIGVILYELVTGRLPHDADSTLGLLARIMREPPRPVKDGNPEVSEHLALVVHRLLEKEPARRYASAAELVEDLEGALLTLRDIPLVLGPDDPGTDEVPPPPGAAPELPTQDSPTSVSVPARMATPTSDLEGPFHSRTARGAAVLGRIAIIDRLAEGGHPAAGLHAASTVARELLADPPLHAFVIDSAPGAAPGSLMGSGVGRAESGRRSAVLPADPLGHALVRVLEALRDPAVALRPLASLLAAVEPIRLLDARAESIARSLVDEIERRRAAPPQVPLKPIHPLAVVHLAEIGVGLALAWKWDEIPAAYDDAVIPLDPEGRQQVQAAAAALTTLLGSEEHARFRAFNVGRQIVPVVSIGNVGAIEGPSAGLPTFLAMVAAYFGLSPRRGFAASGAIDAASIPPVPPDGAAARGAAGRVLGSRIGRVEAVRVKLEAVLEQRPDVELVLLPAANRAEIEADQALLRAAAESGVELRFAATLGEALAADLFEEKLLLDPLRRADGAREDAALQSAVRLAWAAALAALAFVALAARVCFGGGLLE